ncbi:MAG: hypothetical protein GDYSWBUE_000534 [Candidatus Fervidibacterota bacterium]
MPTSTPDPIQTLIALTMGLLIVICGLIIILGGGKLLGRMLASLLGCLVGCTLRALAIPLFVLLCLFLLLSFYFLLPPRFDWSQTVLKYAPVYYFHPDERFFPVGVEWISGNADILLRLPLAPDRRLGPASLETLPTNSEQCYLDFYPNSVWNTNFWTVLHKVYAHIKYERRPGKLNVGIQYWLFYAFNDTPVNSFDHQGDWEMVQISLEGYDERHLSEKEVIYYQHGMKNSKPWSDSAVTKLDQTHPVVWVALGSHASYFQSGSYPWRYIGKVTAITDTTAASPAVAIKLIPPGLSMPLDMGTQTYHLHILSSETWLDYAGRWGRDIRLPPLKFGESPRGPKQHHKEWSDP